MKNEQKTEEEPEIHCPKCQGTNVTLIAGAPDSPKSRYECSCGWKFARHEGGPIDTIARSRPPAIQTDQKTQISIPHLPVFYITAETCGEAWEKAVEAVWYNGLEVEQHYMDEWSKEATVLINVTNPLTEPRFSRKDFVSVTMFLTGEDKHKPYREKQYVKDVLDGDMDYRVSEGIESYTYHERLCKWGMKNPKHEELLKEKSAMKMELINPKYAEPNNKMLPDEGIDQIALMIQKACEEPISRKLQVVTWEPHKDLLISGAPCYDKETEVLTKHGWKLFQDLNGKEYVLTLSPETDQMEYQQITKIISYLYKGKLIACNTHSCNFSVTPNHQMLILHRRTNEKKLVQADQLPIEFYIKRDGNWNRRDRKFVYFDDGKTVRMDDWVQFLAIYLADGSTTMNSEPNGQNRPKGRYRARVTTKKSKKEYREIIEKVARQLNISVSEIPDVHSQGCIHFTFYSKTLNAYLKKFGRSHEKYVPDFVKNLSTRQIRLFLEAFRLGDSTNNGNTIRYNSTSKLLLDGLQELVLKSGNVTGADLWKRNGIEYYELKERAYINGVSVNKGQISYSEYNDYVYCIEVPKHHIIYVRRNGKPMWCGNCLQRLWFRILGEQHNYLVEEVEFRSRDLYKAWGSNALALTELGKSIADQLGMTLVQYTDFSNSLHLYRSDNDQLERHFEILKKREEEKQE
jgi:thymidylate synthase